MICHDKSYNVMTLLHLICVFSIVVRLSRHSTDELLFILNLDCWGIMLIVATLPSELVSSMFVIRTSSTCEETHDRISSEEPL